MTIPGVVSVYCDGSSHSTGGKPGGFGWVIVMDKNPLAAGSGGDPETTNNVMELRAGIYGLRGLKALFPFGAPGPVELVSDSKYALGLASGKNHAVKNKEDAEELKRLCEELGVFQFRWVKGHNGNKWNERCDSIAKLAKKRHTPVGSKEALEAAARDVRKAEKKAARKAAKLEELKQKREAA